MADCPKVARAHQRERALVLKINRSEDDDLEGKDVKSGKSSERGLLLFFFSSVVVVAVVVVVDETDQLTVDSVSLVSRPTSDRRAANENQNRRNKPNANPNRKARNSKQKCARIFFRRLIDSLKLRW